MFLTALTGPAGGIYLLRKVAQNLAGCVTALTGGGESELGLQRFGKDDTNRKLILRERIKAALDDKRAYTKRGEEVSRTFENCYFA